MNTRRAVTRTRRITQLRESIARRALNVAGAPTDTRILDVRRVGTVFIVATAEPANRWAPYAVDTFRIPTSDTTDLDYEEGQAPKRWGVLAGWGADDLNGVPGMVAKATAYARSNAA